MEYVYLMEDNNRKYACYATDREAEKYKQNDNIKMELIPLIQSEVNVLLRLNNSECYRDLTRDQLIEQLQSDIDYYKSTQEVHSQLYEDQNRLINVLKDNYNELLIKHTTLKEINNVLKQQIEQYKTLINLYKEHTKNLED